MTFSGAARNFSGTWLAWFYHYLLFLFLANEILFNTCYIFQQKLFEIHSLLYDARLARWASTQLLVRKYNNWAIARQNQNIICAPIEPSDQIGHSPSRIKSLQFGSLVHWAHSKDSHQTWGMPGLMWVFVGRRCHYVGCVGLRLN